MFDSTLIESGNLQRRKGGWLTASVSFLVHSAIIGGLIYAGMYMKDNPEIIEKPIEAFMVTSAPPPPPPPPPPASSASHPQTPRVVPQTPQDTFHAPTEMPQELPDVEVDSSVTDGGVEGGVVGGVEGGVVGGVVGGTVGGVLGGQLDQPMRVGGNVKQPEVLRRVEPSYTELARRARVQGVVILEAIIDRAGNVSEVRVLKPLPMGLDQEALKAVKQWKFKPGTLNGQPVPVIFSLTVNFRLQ